SLLFFLYLLFCLVLQLCNAYEFRMVIRSMLESIRNRIKKIGIIRWTHYNKLTYHFN
ncbi:hypothetical protein BIFBRE_05120, partial [Bifidobacterium breve DSM 20213 = JCM 1192]